MEQYLVWILGSRAKSVFQQCNWPSMSAIELPVQKGLMQTLLNHDCKLLAAAAITSMLFITYVVTSLQSVLAMNSAKQHGKRPPTVPYWIPFLGNVISFFWNGPRLTAQVVEKFGQSVPAGLQLGPIKIYLVGDPDHVNILLKPTPAITAGPGLVIAMRNVFGTPNEVIPLYIGDDSGPFLKPNPGCQVQPENRIRFFHTKNAHKYLAGSNGIRLGELYMEILSRNISADASIGFDWIHLPDLYLFIQNLVFRAGSESLCGSSILSLNPTLAEDFWEFEQSIPTLLKGFPRWLCPGAYRRRDKVLNMIKKWHKFANEKSDFTKTGFNDPEWDEYFGSKYVKGRQSFLHEIDIMNADGRASEDLGLLFALNGNSAPSVFWTVFEVFTRPGLLSRVREISQSVCDTRAEESESVKLGGSPLLQSIFAEVMRLRIVGILSRVIAGGEFHLGEWSLPEGSILGIPSRTGAMNKKVWNAGTELGPHPLDKFWEDRFLIYPDKIDSGPLRKQGTAFDPSEHKKSRARSPTEIEAPREPSFSLKGLGGAYLPFGGGSGICPGHHFAKQEVVCSLAKLALEYDIELQVPSNWEPRMNTAFFPIGALPPVDKGPFRIRRRLH